MGKTFAFGDIVDPNQRFAFGDKVKTIGAQRVFTVDSQNLCDVHVHDSEGRTYILYSPDLVLVSAAYVPVPPADKSPTVLYGVESFTFKDGTLTVVFKK